MILASRIERFATLSTFAPTAHVLLDSQDMLTRPTKHYSFVSLTHRPHIGLVGFTGIMATDAGVELLAAEVLNGDDVQWRVPMSALGQRGDAETVNDW